jgi:hypothetical protein
MNLIVIKGQKGYGGYGGWTKHHIHKYVVQHIIQEVENILACLLM